MLHHALQLTNLAATWALVGLIWTIQVVHYPGFRYVGADRWTDFHGFHVRGITYVVLPLMLAELVAAGWLWLERPADWRYWLPFLCVVLIWASTFLVSVPLHDRLAGGVHADFTEQLILTNWIRTVLWTLRAGLVTGVFWKLYLASVG